MNNYIIVGDPHIKYTAPVFRKETYFEELKDKIKQINSIAQENNAQIICLGDFFNSYVEDYFESIMYELSDLIKDWTSLIGNHDCKNVNGDLKGTSFGILEKMHYINIEAPKGMDFFHYYNREEFNGKSENKIALIHDYIMPSGTKENFEYKECSENDYKLVFCGHWHCFSSDTEILTENGWKYFYNLSYKDKVLTLNLEKSRNNNILEYNNINKIIERGHYGEMYHIQSSFCDLLVTPEHRLICKPGSWSEGYTFVSASNTYKSASRYPLSGTLDSCGIGLSDDQIKFIVWCISDGWIDSRGKPSINFRLKKPRKIDSLICLLNKMNLKFTQGVYSDGAVRIRVSGKENNLTYLFYLIGRNTSEKSLPYLFRHANKHQANIIFDTYSITDGHLYKNKLQLSTSKKIECDILQEMFCKNGFRCDYSIRKYSNENHKDSFILNITPNQETTYLKPSDNFKIETYRGKVYCVSVDNSTVVVRRNGKVMITGNCPFDINVGRTRYINPGSLMRSTVKELLLNRIPEVILLNDETLEVKHIPLNVKPLLEVSNAEENKLDKTFESKFADMLLQSDLTNNDSNDIINILKKNNVEVSIIEYIDKKLEELK